MDPLAENAPGWTPYRYGFNNPISYIDPDGNFETKFGAWLHKTFKGGDDIFYAKDKGEWAVGSNVESGDAVTYKREFGNLDTPSSGLIEALDHLPSNLGFAGKKYLETGETIENTGDIISGVGLVVTPYAPPVGVGIMAYGEGISNVGVGMQILDTMVSPGTAKEKATKIGKKVATEVIPGAVTYPLKKALKKSNLDKESETIIRSLIDGGGYGIEKALEGVIK